MLLELLRCYGWARLDLSWPGHKGKWTHQVCLAVCRGWPEQPPKKASCWEGSQQPSLRHKRAL